MIRQQQQTREPDDPLAQGARGVHERDETRAEREAQARHDLETYAQRRVVNRDTRIIAELAPLVDRAKAAGLDMNTIAALAYGKEAV